MEEANKSFFTLELLQAINDWQRNGYGENKVVIGNKLVELTKELPDEFRKYSGCCYRKFNSNGKISLLLGLTEFINESFSSWTTDYSFCKEFGKSPNMQQIGIIFYIDLYKSDVVLNLQTLYENDEFQASLELYKNNISDFELGIGRYGAQQKEVILAKNNLSIENIVAYFGKGSDKNTFIRKYYPTKSEKEKQEISKWLENKHPNIGKKRWVEDKESVTSLIKLHKIDSLLLTGRI